MFYNMVPSLATFNKKLENACSTKPFSVFHNGFLEHIVCVNIGLNAGDTKLDFYALG